MGGKLRKGNAGKYNMTQPKVKWVDSWRDVPCDDANSTLAGYCNPKTGEIYAIRGRTSEASIEHEKYHVKKNHPEHPKDYRDFAVQEIEATKYAYDKIRKPSHIKEKLRAIINDIMKTYKPTPNQCLSSVETALDKVDAPKTWIDDFKSVVKEANKTWHIKYEV